MEDILMSGFLRTVGEYGYVLLVTVFVILGIVGFIVGKKPIHRSRPESRAVVQERRLEQEEDTRDSGRI